MLFIISISNLSTIRPHHSTMHMHCVSTKVPTFKLPVTLSNLNQFSKFLHCWKAYEICHKTHLTLGMLLYYFGKLKVKFSVDVE